MREANQVLACGALALPVQAAVRRRGLDIEVRPLPALLHNRPERIAPAVKRLLPPDSSSGAASSMSTEAPSSRAASAAQYAALPAPTTMTSQSFI